MHQRSLVWGAIAGWALLGGWAQGGEFRSAHATDVVFAEGQASWVTPISTAARSVPSGDAVPVLPVAFCNQDRCGLFSSELGEPWTLSSLFGDEPCATLGGWFQGGYHNRKDGTFNTYPHHFQLQQGWLYLDRPADGSNGLGFGGRVDLVYGTDAGNTQSFGNTPGVFDYSDAFNRGDEILQSSYGWAIPQLFAEAAYGDWKVRAGHYFTFHGYEVVPATGNFFYSHSFTMNYSEAFTHTGVHSTYTGIENVELYVGWCLGWDTGFDQFDGGNAFHGGFKVSPVEDIAFVYVTSVGNLGWVGQGYAHSVVIDFTLTEKLHYITQSDFIHTSDSDVIGKDYDTIGWNNFLIYWASDRVGLGGRAEWWKAQGVSYYQLTAGMNFKPMANMVIRPEIRYQWSPAAEGPAAVNPMAIPSLGDGIFGVDAILTF